MHCVKINEQILWECRAQQSFHLFSQGTLLTGSDIDFLPGLSKHLLLSSPSDFSLDLKLFENKDNTLFPLSP